MTATTTISSGTGASDWHGRGYYTRRTDGVLVEVYRVGSGHNTSAVLHIRFQKPDGTWTAANTTIAGDAVTGFPMSPPTGTISYGEGVPLTAPNGDLLIEMWSVDGVSPTGTLQGTYQSRATDGLGHAWSDPEAVTFTDNPHADTSTFMTDDWFPHPDGTLYMGARFYEEGDGVPSASLLMKSANNGTGWTYDSTVCGTTEGGTGGQEFGMELIALDKIRTFIRDNPHTNSFKRDGTIGSTVSWGALEDVTSTIGNAGRQRLYTIAHLKGEANWWEDPEMVMGGFIHNVPGVSQGRTPVVWYSPDRFTTVHGPFGLDTTTADSGYGDLAWDFINDRLIATNYHGTQAAAVLKQYDLALTGT